MHQRRGQILLALNTNGSDGRKQRPPPDVRRFSRCPTTGCALSIVCSRKMSVVVAKDHYRYPTCVCPECNLPSVVKLKTARILSLVTRRSWPLSLSEASRFASPPFDGTLFERPINNLRRYFKYERDQSPKKAIRVS